VDDSVPVDYAGGEIDGLIENSPDAEKVYMPIAHFDFSFALWEDLVAGIASATL